jgi:type IV secretion system protein VirD4
MLLLGLGCMILATQRIAAFWNYQPALGKPLFTSFGQLWYAPWSALEWQNRFAAHDAYGFMEQAVTQSQALFLLPQFVILGVWPCFMKKLRSNANLHGSARWAEEPEIRRMGYFEGKGVYVGGWMKKFSGFSRPVRSFQGKPEEIQLYLRHNGPEHIMVFAPTRSGKGDGLILPTLLAWEGSSIVLDIKGENWALTSGWRRSIGQKTVGGKVVVPEFTDSEKARGLTDFNDLHVSRGLEEVQRQMNAPDLEHSRRAEQTQDKGLERGLSL